MNKLFRHVCRFYSHHSTVFSALASDAGFGNFNDATSRLKKHEASVRHQNATFARIDYKLMKKNETSCASMLKAQHVKLVQENRHYMTAVWKAIRLCSLQGIGLHDHREDLGAIDSNPGNSLSLTEYYREEFEKFTTFLTSKKCRNLLIIFDEKGRFGYLLRSLHFGSNRLISILSDYDSVIHDRLNESTTAKYTHHSIQNELI